MNYPALPTFPATIADLRDGDWAALWFPSDTGLVYIISAEPHQDWGTRVEWRGEASGRRWVRYMPNNNPVQIHRR